MSLTVFLAICILGCDVLIYFLYEWAFGESKDIRRRCARTRVWGHTAEVRSEEKEPSSPRRVRIIEVDRRARMPAAAWTRPNAHQERLAYRRLAASYVTMKPRT
jgi:hypothetical protein